MRILFFNYEYPPLGGGAANATAYILKEYSKIPDLSIDLITSSIDSEYHLEKIDNNIFIHKLPVGKNKENLHCQSRKELLIYTWRAYFFAKKLIKENSYDLSHSFFTVPCGFVSFLIKKKYNIPYVISLRGSDVPGYSNRFAVLYFFIKPLVGLIWKKAFAVIANSKGLKKLAEKTNSKQLVGIIHNGIDIENFKPKPEARPVNNFIITVGASRITERKGIDYLIKSIAKLVPQYPQLLLRIMGEGDARKSLEKLTKDLGLEKNIEFVGRILRENTAPYYQEASVFVLPSFNEGMSNAMLEALGSGLPLIATNTGGTSELVEDEVNGFIVKMKNSQDLANKIEILVKDENLQRKMGEASRQKAETMSWEKVAREYADIYHKIKK